jgi:antitoxin YefM
VARRVSAREARTHFSDLIGSVHYGKEPVIVERNGKPFAVVISPDQYAVMERELGQAWRDIESLRELNADKDPDEILRDVTAVVEEVRQERYAKRRSPTSRRR